MNIRNQRVVPDRHCEAALTLSFQGTGAAAGDEAVVPFGELVDGVRQEREDVEGGERVCQMLFAVAEVVVKMVALGFERVVVPVLDGPAGTAARGQLHGVPGVHIQIGRPAVAVGLPPLGVGHGQFDPVRPERAVLP